MTVVPLTATPSSHGRPFRFTRQFRLKSPLSIRRILQDAASSRRRFGAFRVVWSGKQDRMQSTVPRFAFVVSREAGPAVVRNRLKRRLREAVRLQRDIWPSNPVDVIIRINDPKAAELPFAALAGDVREALLLVKSRTGHDE